MSRFTTAVIEKTGRVDNRGRHELICVSPLAYEAFFKGSGWWVEAPAHFLSDGVSYPTWLPGWIVDRMPLDKMLRAAVIHDLMRRELRYPKLLGDYLFFEAMGVEGVGLFWRTVCFVAVLLNTSRH